MKEFIFLERTNVFLLYTMLSNNLKVEELEIVSDTELRVNVIEKNLSYFYETISGYCLLLLLDELYVQNNFQFERSKVYNEICQELFSKKEVMGFINKELSELLKQQNVLRLHGFRTFTLNSITTDILELFEDIEMFGVEEFKTNSCFSEELICEILEEFEIDYDGLFLYIKKTNKEIMLLDDLLLSLNTNVIVNEEKMEKADDPILYYNISILTTLIITFKTKRLHYKDKNSKFVERLMSELKQYDVKLDLINLDLN